MRNKFFPTFEQDIGATAKLCVLTILFIVVTAVAIDTAFKGINQAYRKVEADVLKSYADAQKKQAIECMDGTTAPTDGFNKQQKAKRESQRARYRSD
ncbi:hypothetical protein BH11CYA1_BH11CYA1_00220 [soil metagenome]